MDEAENRGNIRRIVAIAARVEGLGALRHIVIRNLSEKGCSFTRPNGVSLGSPIRIFLGDSIPPIEAVIVWLTDGFVGCRFGNRLRPDVVNHLSRLATESCSAPTEQPEHRAERKAAVLLAK